MGRFDELCDQLRDHILELRGLVRADLESTKRSLPEATTEEVEVVHDDTTDGLAPAATTTDIFPELAGHGVVAIDTTGLAAPTPTRCSMGGLDHNTDRDDPMASCLLPWSTPTLVSASSTSTLAVAAAARAVCALFPINGSIIITKEQAEEMGNPPLIRDSLLKNLVLPWDPGDSKFRLLNIRILFHCVTNYEFLALPWKPGQQAFVGHQCLTNNDFTAVICARDILDNYLKEHLKGVLFRWYFHPSMTGMISYQEMDLNSSYISLQLQILTTSSKLVMRQALAWFTCIVGTLGPDSDAILLLITMCNVVNPFSVLSSSREIVLNDWVDSDVDSGSVRETSDSKGDEKVSAKLVSDWEDSDDNDLQNQCGLRSYPDEGNSS